MAGLGRSKKEKGGSEKWKSFAKFQKNSNQ
jgi:hypothetical protein